MTGQHSARGRASRAAALAPGRGPVVAVTGTSGPAGAAVAAALQRRVGELGGPSEVLAVDDWQDDSREELAGVSWRIGDLAAPGIADCLTGADVVVHTAAPDDLAATLGLGRTERRAKAVRTVQAVSMAAAAVGAGRLIAVTSAMIYGARPENPVPLPDDADERVAPDDGPVGDLLEIERVLERVPQVHPGLSVSVLRPAALVGPGTDTVISRHFEAPRLLLVRGGLSRWQFCHLDDLGAAVDTVFSQALEGPLTVACTGALDNDEVEQIAGMRRVEVPSGLAFATAEQLHRVGVLRTPASDLAFVAHPWVVGAQRLRDAGWAPEHSNAECLQEMLDQIAARRASVPGRRVDRREAALGAAGAAVALLGTAAVLRQARSRQAQRRRPTLDP